MKQIIFTPALILFLILTLFGCSSLSSLDQTVDAKNIHHKIIFIKEHWHTSIVLEAAPLLMAMPELESELRNQPYVRVGWGDGDFFSGKNKSNLSATRALFISDYSAMQVLTYDKWPGDDFDESARAILLIDDRGLEELIHFIRNSFVFNADQSLKPLQAYNENTGSFFVAREHYSVFNNCNAWTGKALQVAGLPVGFHLTPSGLLRDAKNISRQQLTSNHSAND